jgi:multidrug efflux pump subunit AcrA (membrane-fusion protein)
VGVVRKWVFPILRLLVFSAIAVALVKIAFFPDAQEASTPEFPDAQIVEPQVAVALGTVRNDVILTATVSADEAVPIKATLAGEVKKLLVSPGQAVDVGTPILTLRAEIMRADGSSTYIKIETVTSPAAGILSDFPTLVGQLYSVGDTVGKVAPPTFHVSGSLAPEQLYRLTVQPTEAEVMITGGPAPFQCTGLVISTPLEGQEGAGASGPTVTCAIPSDVKVFPGLTAQLTLVGGIAENVLIVPITAVEGLAETGNVYVVLPDGSTETRPVTLGLNDGFNVEIKGGLVEGDLVLEYVPGAVAVDPGIDGPMGFGECFIDDQGNEICTEVSSK